ncbi:GNAT family N-acetyltransferase [Embleya scabrispora]|uniref:GNAT family N-acetyltransferase n=1 Tax=Embleya scabrispora TaxID=159449 RepID=UPI0019143574|nr:GNAT family protein [Embleya scabrispora]
MTRPEIVRATESLAIGPRRHDLLDTYLRWTNDPVVMRGNGRFEPEEREVLRAALDVMISGPNAHFTVYDRLRTDPHEGPLPIGTATLSIDRPVAAAEFFITLGEEGRGRGLAAPATRLVLDFAFEEAGLENVFLAVLEPNVAAIRAYTRAGFQRIGHRRRSALWAGSRVDEVLMDAIPTSLEPA